MPTPILAALAPAAIQTIGGLAARAIAGKVEVPNLVAPAINTAQNQLFDLENSQVKNLALLEDQASRTGFGGTAGREDLLNANARGDAAIRGSILDTIVRARQQQELIETDIKNAQRQATIEGITGGANAVAGGVSNLLNPVDTTGGANVTSTPIGIPGVSNQSAGFIGGGDLLSQVNRTINPANELVELDFRPGQSLTSFSKPISALPSSYGTFSQNFFKTLQ